MSITKNPLYRVWDGMMQRCTNPNNISYHNYGGRGIRVCASWLSSSNFIKDMSPTYEKGLQIDRIDNDGDYSPENCRWVTPTVQENNRRDNVRLLCGGQNNTITEWSRITGIHEQTIRNRINAGQSPEQALTNLNTRAKMVSYQGETKSVTDFCKELNLHYRVVTNRLSRGWTVEKALSTPTNKPYKGNR